MIYLKFLMDDGRQIFIELSDDDYEEKIFEEFKILPEYIHEGTQNLWGIVDMKFTSTEYDLSDYRDTPKSLAFLAEYISHIKTQPRKTM